MQTNAADAELVRQYKEGDEHAFTLLFERYWKDIIGFCRTHVKSLTRAEEIANDAFYAVAEKIKKMRRMKEFKDLIYNMVQKLCTKCNRLKKKVKEISLEALEDVGVYMPDPTFDSVTVVELKPVLRLTRLEAIAIQFAPGSLNDDLSRPGGSLKHVEYEHLKLRPHRINI